MSAQAKNSVMSSDHKRPNGLIGAAEATSFTQNIWQISKSCMHCIYFKQENLLLLFFFMPIVFSETSLHVLGILILS